MDKMEKMFALIADNWGQEFADLVRTKYEAGSGKNCVADAMREWYGLDA